MPVTQEQARQAVTLRVMQLHATWTEFPLWVEFQNSKPVNIATQVHPFLRVSLVYQGGEQVDLSDKPAHRASGTLVVEALCKEGEGTAAANRLLAHFYPHLQMTDSMYPVRAHAARFASHPPVLGWFAQAALIPFWYDSIPA